MSEDELKAFTLNGAYVLHDFAAPTWVGLVEGYLAFCSDISTDLTDALIILAKKRSNGHYEDENENIPVTASLKKLGDSWPAVNDMVCASARFHQVS